MKNKIIIIGIVAAVIMVVVIIAILLSLYSSPKTEELVSEYACIQDGDCVARLPKGSCQWEIINKETAIQRDADATLKNTDNIADIEVSCGGLVPIETLCKKGYCVGKMQYSDFYH